MNSRISSLHKSFEMVSENKKNSRNGKKHSQPVVDTDTEIKLLRLKLATLILKSLKKRQRLGKHNNAQVRSTPFSVFEGLYQREWVLKSSRDLITLSKLLNLKKSRSKQSNKRNN